MIFFISLNFLERIQCLFILTLAALAQMVACLPLVQRVQGLIPRRVVNFHLKIFNLGARRGGDIHSTAVVSCRMRCCRFYTLCYWIVHHSPGLNSKPFRSTVYMLRRHIVLSIVIRPSDGDVKPGGPLGAFREEQAMSWHRVSPSPFLSSSSYTTQLHYTNSYTYS